MLLEVKNLTIKFTQEDAELTVVNDISFCLEQGKTLAIVGESGSGKSMTSLAIMGLIEKPGKVSQGEILFKGEDLLKFSEKKLLKMRGKDISMIFQDPMTSLNPSFTIGYQIDEVLRLHKKDLNKVQRKEKVLELLALVGIKAPKQKYSSYPFKMSGGQRQRAMIAMAMACEPKLLIADEPTTALDVTIQAQVLELMLELQKKNNMALVFITHDLALVSKIADEVLVMYKGNIVEKSSSKVLFKNPKHPYTKALLSSIPSLEKPRKTKLQTIDENIDYLSFPRSDFE